MTSSALARAALIGVATGFRSQLGMAMLALTTGGPEAGRPASLFASRWAKAITATAAVGELVADKLPGTPSRLGASGFMPRVALGALTAALLVRREPGDGTPAAAAAVGAVAAAGGTLAGAWWRGLARGAGRPDWPAAVTEDLAALTLAYASCGPAPCASPEGDEGADRDEDEAVIWTGA